MAGNNEPNAAIPSADKELTTEMSCETESSPAVMSMMQPSRAPAAALGQTISKDQPAVTDEQTAMDPFLKNYYVSEGCDWYMRMMAEARHANELNTPEDALALATHAFLLEMKFMPAHWRLFVPPKDWRRYLESSEPSTLLPDFTHWRGEHGKCYALRYNLMAAHAEDEPCLPKSSMHRPCCVRCKNSNGSVKGQHQALVLLEIEPTRTVYIHGFLFNGQMFRTHMTEDQWLAEELVDEAAPEDLREWNHVLKLRVMALKIKDYVGRPLKMKLERAYGIPHELGCTLDYLPPELLLKIVKYLKYKGLCRVTMTNRRLRAFMDDNSRLLWLRRVHIDYPLYTMDDPELMRRKDEPGFCREYYQVRKVIELNRRRKMHEYFDHYYSVILALERVTRLLDVWWWV